MAPERQELLDYIDAMDSQDPLSQHQFSIFGPTPSPEGSPLGTFLEQEGLRTGGEISGAISGARIGSSFGPWGLVIGGALGAGGGAFMGEELQAVREGKDSDEAVRRAFAAGGEAALWDLAGGTLFHTGSKLWNKLRAEPKSIESIRKLVEEHGGQLTAAQLTDNTLVQGVDATVRGAFFGPGNLIRADLKNKEAVDSLAHSISQIFHRTSLEELSERGLGEYIKNLVDGGNILGKSVVKTFYENLDNLVPPQRLKIAKRIPKTSKVLTAEGKPFTTVATEITETVKGPVHMKGVRDWAKPLLKRAEKLKAGLGEKTITQLKGLATQEDYLTFSEAHELRSNMKAMIRDLERQQKETKLRTVLGKAVERVEKQMERAAFKVGVWDDYKGVNHFYRQNMEHFRNTELLKLLKDDTSLAKIGDSIYQHGSYVNLEKIKKAFRRATVLEKEFPRTAMELRAEGKLISPELKDIPKKTVHDAMDRIRAGYLRRLFKDDYKNLGAVLKDKDKMETMKELFTGNQIDNFKRLQKVIETTSAKPDVAGAGGIIRWQQFTQGGAVALGGFSVMAGQPIGVGAASFVLVGPKIAGYLMTKPNFINLLIRASKVRPNAAAAGGLTSLIIKEINKAKSVMGEEDPMEKTKERAELEAYIEGME